MNIRMGVILGSGLLLALLTSGCGGLSASPSVSPGSFFLPGLLKNEAPKKQDPVVLVPSQEVKAGNPRS